MQMLKRHSDATIHIAMPTRVPFATNAAICSRSHQFEIHSCSSYTSSMKYFRNPALPTGVNRSARSWGSLAIQRLLSMLCKNAAPRDPPMCGLFSLQSRHFGANFRRLLRSNARLMPRSRSRASAECVSINSWRPASSTLLSRREDASLTATAPARWS